MRIAQVVLPDAPLYERKSQRIDRAALSARHEVMVVSLEDARRSGAEVVHVYGEVAYVGKPGFLGVPRSSSAFLGSGFLGSRFLEWLRSLRGTPRNPRNPRNPGEPVLVSPLSDPPLPEAVEEIWFGARPRRVASDAKIIGTFSRPDVRSLIDRTLSRIHRFRDDVSWHLFEKEPSPDDLLRVDAWIDPAVRENDFDGFVAEALVLGLPVIATRTPVNAQRLEQGRTGFLVPVDDPNEMTHAILTALFKIEASASRQNAAEQTASKFRPRQRLRMLEKLYEQTNA